MPEAHTARERMQETSSEMGALQTWLAEKERHFVAEVNRMRDAMSVNSASRRRARAPYAGVVLL